MQDAAELKINVPTGSTLITVANNSYSFHRLCDLISKQHNEIRGQLHHSKTVDHCHIIHSFFLINQTSVTF